MRKILVIGCGYTGERIARRHLARGDTVIAATRDPARGERLRIAGAGVLHRDLDADQEPFPQAERVYYLAPPSASGQDDPRIARALALLPPPAEFIYFSTTGVYGDTRGTTVNEDAPLRPGTSRAGRRVAAENRVRSWTAQHDVLASVLRVAGIYGPGRLPLTRLENGDPVPEDTGPGNRIHVDDLAAAAVAIGDSREGGAWNITDGNPLSVAAFNDLVADAAGLPRPRRVPLDSAEISAGMRSFLSESRRIDNRRLLALQDFRLIYPDPERGVLDSLRKRRVADIDEEGKT